ALSVVAVTTGKLSRAERARAAPFVRAQGDADRALRNLRGATRSRDERALTRALREATQANGRLNSTYRRSNIGDRRVREGMRALNASWDQTVRRFGAAGRGNPELARSNARRISAVRSRLEAQRVARSRDAQAVAELALMVAMLDRALLLNRDPRHQWYALVALDDVYGYYAGYYDYVVVYEPRYVEYFRDDFRYWRGVNERVYDSYDYYYQDWSYTSYEQTTIINQSVEVNVNIVNNTTIIEADNRVDSIQQVVDSTSLQTDGYSELVEFEVEVAAESTVEFEDPATIANVEVDAAVLQQPSADEIAALAEEAPPSVEAVEDLIEEEDPALIEAASAESVDRSSTPDDAAGSGAMEDEASEDAMSEDELSDEVSDESASEDAAYGDAASEDFAPEEDASGGSDSGYGASDDAYSESVDEPVEDAASEESYSEEPAEEPAEEEPAAEDDWGGESMPKP
ncbi:MAG: hypothetical protein ACK55W_06835, partial [Pseudomonadota bacterium]